MVHADTDDSEPPEQSIVHTLESLKAAIWQRRPILGEIIKKHGAKILTAYTRDFMDVNPSPLLDQRKHELISVAKNLIERRLGVEIAEKAERQLKKFALVSTADHHGPIDHPLFVNANIISAIPYYDWPDPDISCLIVFSFSSISVNNASAYPRGIEFHGGMNGSGNFIRLPILPDKLKMGVVYGTRAFTREDLVKAESELAQKEKSGDIAAGRGEKIRQILEQFFGTSQVLSAPDLCTQITEINFRLWPSLFHPVKKPIPDLIYLEIETLATELLRKYHLKNPQSLIYRLFFNPDFMNLSRKYFNNLAGGFSLENKSGTYFFWALDEKQHRCRLELSAGKLHTQTKKFEYDFTPEGIDKALQAKQIFPSMLICYLIVSLFYGMKCLGGFCQVHDLTLIKEAWGKILREIGENKEAEALIPVQTKELGGDGLVLAYLKTAKDEFVPATGIDMALEEGDTSYENYVELAKHATLAEIMKPMLPEIYTVLYSSSQRNPHLLKYAPEQILKATRPFSL